jgi:hypothetical protein
VTLIIAVTDTNLGQRNIVEVRGKSPTETSMADANDCSNLFVNMLSVIKDSSRQMQESNEKLKIRVEESNKALQNHVFFFLVAPTLESWLPL